MSKFTFSLKWLLSIALFLATSCNDDLKNDVDDLKGRVTTIEESVSKLQQAIDAGKLITSVTPIEATADSPGGWLVTFSDKTSIEVNHGEQGETGPQGLTPYVWINHAGNWAANAGSKPADSDNAIYEIKVDGQSVKAYGTSVRTCNIDGFVGFEEYDQVSGVVTKTVKTTIPFDHKNYISLITETDESVTMIINSKSYTLAKAANYPASITIIRDKDYVIKGGSVSFEFAVNPSTCKAYTQENFEIDYEEDYAPTRSNPDFIRLKTVEPAATAGHYTMTLEWAESDEEFAKDAPIFIVLNFTDAKGNPAKVISATPVIMNEEYVSIENKHVQELEDVTMFSDETYTGWVRLADYHEGYVDKVDYSMVSYPSTEPVALNPLTRYTAEGDKYKFTIVPIPASNNDVWGSFDSLHTDVTAAVTDYGRAAVPETPARPEIGQPAVPGIPAIDPNTVSQSFCVTVYRVPEYNEVCGQNFESWWLPNRTVDYRLTAAFGEEIKLAGYDPAKWNLAIESQTLHEGEMGPELPMTGNVTADNSKFNVAGNFTLSYKLLPTIQPGMYSIDLVVKATSKTLRPAELKQEREFKIWVAFEIVAPTFRIYTNNNLLHNQIDGDTYHTYKLADLNIADLLDVESTENISKSTDVDPETPTLSYEFDLSAPRHGAQGVRFDPYPAVSAPGISEWGSSMFVRKPIRVIVRLATGQELPVQIWCKENAYNHAEETFYVQYDRLNLSRVDAGSSVFNGNYNAMINTGVNVAAGANFTPKAANGTALDASMIRKTAGIVFSEVGTVQCLNGELPSGLQGKKILTIDTTTGLVKSIDGMTWQNPEAVLYQTFRVTYTDIWSNSASKDVKVYVKSNSVPTEAQD